MWAPGSKHEFLLEDEDSGTDSCSWWWWWWWCCGRLSVLIWWCCCRVYTCIVCVVFVFSSAYVLTLYIVYVCLAGSPAAPTGSPEAAFSPKCILLYGGVDNKVSLMSLFSTRQLPPMGVCSVLVAQHHIHTPR